MIVPNDQLLLRNKISVFMLSEFSIDLRACTHSKLVLIILSGQVLFLADVEFGSDIVKH